MPYLSELGVDMVWLNPFYPSPQRDNGYDISDYTAVNSVFGDMADFEEMVRVGKEHKIDFMLDMVLNHCSTEHEWFQKALAGTSIIKISTLFSTRQQIGCLNLAALLGHHFGDTGKYYDQPRALNRFLDIKNFRDEGATVLAASIHLSSRTPYIYMGEEIGMVNPEYDSMADYVDVESINAYQMLLDQGKSPEQAFKITQAKSRDNSRTPMQWDASENAGFSTGTPWLKAGKSYKDINVENEINGSIFKLYKELIRLRKEMPIISEGSYQPALEDSQQVYVFGRYLGDQKLLVLNNLYGSEAEVGIPEEYQAGCVLLSNYDDAELAEKVSLKPYQTLSILVK